MRFEIGQRIEAIVDSPYVNYKEGDRATVLKVSRDDDGVENYFVEVDKDRKYWIVPWYWRVAEGEAEMPKSSH